jgi:hypothetical protein
LSPVRQREETFRAMLEWLRTRAAHSGIVFGALAQSLPLNLLHLILFAVKMRGFQKSQVRLA